MKTQDSICELVGGVGHGLWSYSEDKRHRLQDGEVMVTDPIAVEMPVGDSCLRSLTRHGFAVVFETLLTPQQP